MASNKIETYEEKIAGNLYKKIAVKTVRSQSHELTSQGWDNVRVIEMQDSTGAQRQQWLLNPGSCLFLGAGIPPTTPGGRIPFAFGEILATPRNLYLLDSSIKSGLFEIMDPEGMEVFDAQCKRFAKEIAALRAFFEGTPVGEIEEEIAPVEKPVKPAKAKPKEPSVSSPAAETEENPLG